MDESDADDGAIHRFYAWLARRRAGVDLDDVAQLVAAVAQYDGEGDP